MSHDPNDTADSIDKGLAEAFGKRDDASAIPASSVLRILQAKHPSVRAVHLDAPSVDDAPVKVTDEAKALRDPSGRYQLLGEIGRGGIGTVYKGRDQDLGRDVAMKVLRDEYATRPDVLARFVEEAQIGGQLQHPGIVPVYELGLQAGERPYFAMKLVKGETLAAHLARRDAPAKERRRLLGVFEQVCQTVAYAHARRVVHRDLKPANVMIGAFGEVQVVDWGFAKVLAKGGVDDERASVTAASERSVIETVRSSAEPGSGTGSVAGSMLGTPAYMPPEQALGDIERVDQRSDVFALGAILCEVLTGEPPYREQDGDLVRQAANAQLDGAHRRLALSGADAALIALCRECLSPSKRARPESAQEVADRIGRYLTSVEERAQKAELRAAETRFRHRVTLVAASAALLLVAFGAGTWIWVQHDAQQRLSADTRQLAALMNRTSQALGEATATRDDVDLAKWDVVDGAAANLRTQLQAGKFELEARDQAVTLLETVGRESLAARARAAQQRRDEAMVARLVDLRMPVDDEVRRERGWVVKELGRLDAGYLAAFEQHLGGDPFGMPVEVSMDILRASDAETRLELATSIDHWALVRDGLADDHKAAPAAARTGRLRQLAMLLDGDDPWRNSLRRLLPEAANRQAELLALAEAADFAALTPAGCRVLAEALWRAGAGERAVEVLTRAREAHAGDFGLCFQLAFANERLEQPRWDHAEHMYEIANALRPDHDEVLHRQGIALQKLGRIAAAERVFQRLVQRDQDNGHWHSHLGELQDRRGDLGAALESYGRAHHLAPDDPQHLNNYGLALAMVGRRLEARQLYERAIERDPEHVAARVNLGNLLGRMHGPEAALEQYGAAIRIDGRYLPAYIGKGALLLTSGRAAEAERVLRQALAIDPNSPTTLASLGDVSLQLGAVDRAMDFSERALAELQGVPADQFLVNDARPSAHLTLGRAHDAMARRAASTGLADEWGEHRAEALRHYLEVDRSHLPATEQNNLGGNFIDHERYDEATACFRAAIASEPGLPHAHVSLGDVYRLTAWKTSETALRTSLFEQSAASYREAIRLVEGGEPRAESMLIPHRQAYNNLGSVLWSLGDHEGSIDCYRRAIAIDSEFPNPHSNLADAWLHLGEYEQAIDEYRRAAALFRAQGTRWAMRWANRVNRLADASEVLPEILAGERHAGSSQEWSEVVWALCGVSRLDEAIAFVEGALRERPALVDARLEGLFCAARAAALRADEQASDGVERRRLLELARAWLMRSVREGPPSRAEQALAVADFAGVRGDALDALPEPERDAWRALWREIEAAAADR